MAYRHPSAMPAEVVAALALAPGQIVADCTLGGAGHARLLLERISPGGILIGLDRDPAAIGNARQVLAPWTTQTHLFARNFVQLPEVLAELGIARVDGILADLGLSLYQLEASGRGFSFQRDEPLDMRMDPRSGPTAADLIRDLTAQDLSRLFFEFGEERHARVIARRIVSARRRAPIVTSAQLARLVADVAGRKSGRLHPATRVFMALRIAVNRELEDLERFLELAPRLLRPGGRLCVLAFHSLEDRLVKRAFRRLERPCTCPREAPVCTCGAVPLARVLTPKPLRPTSAEVAANPLARSTRLRAIERLEEK
ncbi:MAG: 16S rRNA (cytosine(1402)-N(4))-methyltransferase RsmH [Desulfobacterales bacterium]|jgi:16S rRNA (cytosine1402-N4)-methyltransferase|nr:16S rRNA (cytosine(1402)-N(4))-methyltransferase RsmH [Desulfobacteraceae bacterium]MDD3992235.1 16S rRNA (cytosine(1402)-N(4))-methyltransferase RsmH [Desulfobacteraceae bacterium]MDY0312822.1 16S rRNA (cytosine(1402)-N(4))-methyltransferase RsmH [Desulfobacterales bacterium]